MTPEIRLIQAIVSQAVEDVLIASLNRRRDMKAINEKPPESAEMAKKHSAKVKSAKERQQDGASALRWITSTSEREFGFDWCCEFTGLSAGKIKANILTDEVAQAYAGMRSAGRAAA